MTTKILKCNCKSHAQDTLHGPQMRVHNWAEGVKLWRCTICGTTRTGEQSKARTTGEPVKKARKKKGAKGKAAKK